VVSEPRQKSIGVTPREKEKLDRAKQLYEERTGETTDWGRFLGAVTALGLAALGIYKLVNSSKKNPTAVCAVCGQTFSIAYSEDLPSVVYVTCPDPKCGAELVVDFTESSE
jgi:hypothetical protein